MPALDYQCELLVVSSAAGQNHYKLFSIQINMDIIFFVVAPGWRRAPQPTPVFLPGKSHGQRSLAGCSTWGHKRVRHDWVTKCSAPTEGSRRDWGPKAPPWVSCESPATFLFPSEDERATQRQRLGFPLTLRCKIRSILSESHGKSHTGYMVLQVF